MQWWKQHPPVAVRQRSKQHSHYLFQELLLRDAAMWIYKLIFGLFIIIISSSGKFGEKLGSLPRRPPPGWSWCWTRLFEEQSELRGALLIQGNFIMFCCLQHPDSLSAVSVFTMNVRIVSAQKITYFSHLILRRQLSCVILNVWAQSFLKLAVSGRNNHFMDRDENDAFAIIDDPAEAF